MALQTRVRTINFNTQINSSGAAKNDNPSVQQQLYLLQKRRMSMSDSPTNGHHMRANGKLLLQFNDMEHMILTFSSYMDITGFTIIQHEVDIHSISFICSVSSFLGGPDLLCTNV